MENIDTLKFLTENLGKPTKKSGRHKWVSEKFGFSFWLESTKFCGKKWDTVICQYHRKEFYPYGKEMDGCVIDSSDLPKIFERLNRDPEILYRKPKSVKILEEKMGCKAILHPAYFGAWRLCKNNVSMYNNPFRLMFAGMTLSKNCFEVYIFDEYEEPKSMPLKKVLKILDERDE
jgi:hypothetical protein